LLREEYGDHIPPALAAPPVLEPAVRAKQDELQGRVLNILAKKKKEKSTPAPIAPSLLSAIDSLVKSGPNLLSSLKAPATEVDRDSHKEDYFDSYSQKPPHNDGASSDGGFQKMGDGGFQNDGFRSQNPSSSFGQQQGSSYNAMRGGSWSGSQHGSGYGSQGAW